MKFWKCNYACSGFYNPKKLLLKYLIYLEWILSLILPSKIKLYTGSFYVGSVYMINLTLNNFGWNLITKAASLSFFSINSINSFCADNIYLKIFCSNCCPKIFRCSWAYSSCWVRVISYLRPRASIFINFLLSLSYSLGSVIRVIRWIASRNLNEWVGTTGWGGCCGGATGGAAYFLPASSTPTGLVLAI